MVPRRPCEQTGRDSGTKECKQGKTSETLIFGRLVRKGGTEMADWAGKRQEGRLCFHPDGCSVSFLDKQRTFQHWREI